MKRTHYSWIICLTCTLLIACCLGFNANAFSVYLPYIRRTADMTAGQSSLILTFRCTASLLALFLVIRFYEKTGFRKGMFISALLCALSFLIYYFAQSIPVYYAAAFIGGLSFGLGSMIPVSMLIRRWFADRVGTAIGICTMGTGLSTICIPPAVTALAETHGLKAAFLFESCLAALCAVIIFILIREDPKDKGTGPFGAGRDVIKSRAASYGKRNMTRAELVMAVAMVALVSCSASAVPGHFAALITDRNYSPQFAAMCVSLFGIFISAGKFLFGIVADKIGAYRATMIFYSLWVIGALCCSMITKSPAFAVAMVCIIGFSYPPGMAGEPIWAAELSTKERYASVYRTFQIADLAGTLALSSLPGILYDRFGNYEISYYIFAGTIVMGLVFLTILYRRRKE